MATQQIVNSRSTGCLESQQRLNTRGSRSNGFLQATSMFVYACIDLQACCRHGTFQQWYKAC